MIFSRRGTPFIAALSLVALVATGCTSTSSRMASTSAGPEQLTPVARSTVSSATLPPIGADGQIQQQLPPVGQTGALPPNGPTGQLPPVGQQLPPITNGQPGSFATLDPVGVNPTAGGRVLGPGFTVDSLLGMWTMISGAEQCRLNLTKTAKAGTSRYRASTPGCAMAGLSVVSSWQLAGSQLQLFDENGDIIGTLLLSGDRFVGTLAGGKGVSMVG